MLSHCCRAPLDLSWGHTVCTACWRTVSTPPVVQRRDLIAWLFPPESKARPTSAPVFVRYGRNLERSEGGVRGRPDGWFWCDA